MLVGQRLHLSHDHHLIRLWGIRHAKQFDVDEVLYQHCVKKLLVGYLHDLQEETPRVTDEQLRTRWPQVLRSALREAEQDMNRQIHHVPPLTWAEVFETPYELEEEQPSVAYELAREQSHCRGSQRPCR